MHRYMYMCIHISCTHTLIHAFHGLVRRSTCTCMHTYMYINDITNIYVSRTRTGAAVAVLYSGRKGIAGLKW